MLLVEFSVKWPQINIIFSYGIAENFFKSENSLLHLDRYQEPELKKGPLSPGAF